MLLHTVKCVRTKVSALRPAGKAAFPLAAAVAQRFQHDDAYESCGDALQEFRDNVREFAQRTIAPHAAEVDRQNTFPTSTDLWKDIGEFGLHGMSHRCLQVTLRLLPGRLTGHLCRADSSVRVWWNGCRVPASLCCYGGGLDVGYPHQCVALEVNAGCTSAVVFV